MGERRRWEEQRNPRYLDHRVWNRDKNPMIWGNMFTSNSASIGRFTSGKSTYERRNIGEVWRVAENRSFRMYMGYKGELGGYREEGTMDRLGSRKGWRNMGYGQRATGDNLIRRKKDFNVDFAKFWKEAGSGGKVGERSNSCWGRDWELKDKLWEERKGAVMEELDGQIRSGLLEERRNGSYATMKEWLRRLHGSVTPGEVEEIELGIRELIASTKRVGNRGEKGRDRITVDLESKKEQYGKYGGGGESVGVEPKAGKVGSGNSHNEDQQWTMVKYKKRFVDKEPREVFVANIHDSVGEKDIRILFQRIGLINSVTIPHKRDRFGRRFAFIKFSSIQEAKRAVEVLDGVKLGSYFIGVKVAIRHGLNRARQGKEAGKGDRKAGEVTCTDGRSRRVEGKITKKETGTWARPQE